jgi:hypothetical protein
MPEQMSAVEIAVRAKIAAAQRAREQRLQRAEFDEARAHGLRARHTAKAARVAHCPSCRAPRPTQQISTVKVRGQTYDLIQCQDKACELIWAQRPQAPTATAA